MRTLDIVFSATALLLFAVSLALIAALVRITSGGPVFFRQQRIGPDGKSFNVVKFRSVAAFGRFMQRANLDELPQLWNVLRGDMSIIELTRPKV